MSEGPSQLRGPDFSQGVALNSLVDGEMLLGHVGGEPAVLARRGADLFAVGATCTHYGGPLSGASWWARRCVARGTMPVSVYVPARRCVHRRSTAWHCWRVEQRDGMAFVRERSRRPTRQPPSPFASLGGHHRRGRRGQRGGGNLRREGYDGAITLLSADADRRRVTDPTCRRTISPAPRRRISSRCGRRISIGTTDLKLRLTRGSPRSTGGARVRLEDGSGNAAMVRSCSPPAPSRCRLEVPGAALPHVHCLRTSPTARADSRGAHGAARWSSVRASSAWKWQLRCAPGIAGRRRDARELPDGTRPRPRDRTTSCGAAPTAWRNIPSGRDGDRDRP